MYVPSRFKIAQTKSRGNLSGVNIVICLLKQEDTCVSFVMRVEIDPVWMYRPIFRGRMKWSFASRAK